MGLFFCFVILQVIFLGNLIFKGVSKGPATSMVELFPNLVNNFPLITNVARTSIIDVTGL